MKKRILITLIAVFGVFVCYESYFFLSRDTNASIVMYGDHKNNLETGVLYINNKKIDTLNLKDLLTYLESHSLPWGNSEFSVKDLEGNVYYETNLSFMGVYKWYTFQVNNENIEKSTSYFPRAIQ